VPTQLQLEGIPPRIRDALRGRGEWVYMASHAAATATESRPIAYAPQAATIEAVYFIPNAAITGADTNTTHLNLINRGTDGSGSTELANIDFVAGTDATAFNATEFTLAAGDRVVADGVVALQYEKVGTGLLIPEGLFVVVMTTE
jgi:hypothetical protein